MIIYVKVRDEDFSTDWVLEYDTKSSKFIGQGLTVDEFRVKWIKENGTKNLAELGAILQDMNLYGSSTVIDTGLLVNYFFIYNKNGKNGEALTKEQILDNLCLNKKLQLYPNEHAKSAVRGGLAPFFTLVDLLDHNMKFNEEDYQKVFETTLQACRDQMDGRLIKWIESIRV